MQKMQDPEIDIPRLELQHAIRVMYAQMAVSLLGRSTSVSEFLDSMELITTENGITGKGPLRIYFATKSAKESLDENYGFSSDLSDADLLVHKLNYLGHNADVVIIDYCTVKDQVTQEEGGISFIITREELNRALFSEGQQGDYEKPQLVLEPEHVTGERGYATGRLDQILCPANQMGSEDISNSEVRRWISETEVEDEAKRERKREIRQLIKFGK